jgi:hypothetical protein
VEDDLTRAARRVQTLFRMARDSAISSGRSVTVVVDSLDGLVWIDTREPLGLEAVEVREALAYPEETSARGIVLPTALDAEPEFEQGAPIGLPPTVRMELLRARASFTFLPGGGALADTLVLEGPLGMRVITIDPWTGDVLIR